MAGRGYIRPPVSNRFGLILGTYSAGARLTPLTAGDSGREDSVPGARPPKTPFSAG
jgi:hypothetical protein